ncbi:MAG: bifunctional adenosylcobinamide kinase/adenosylcobinamide-phosphate guanylyltransferase, partial [Pseudomonadota bacterium]
MSLHSLGVGTTLILGGARSGKSAFAEKLVLESGLKPIYIATSQVWDEEMRARVDAHIARRGDNWVCIEAPLELEKALRDADQPGNAILVDCLTLWVTNLMMAEANIGGRFSTLLKQIQHSKAPLVLVTNEVGLGIVPENKMAREFR